MSLRSSWKFGIVCLLVLAGFHAALAAACSVCGRELGRSYLRGKDGKVYCSQECFRSTLPKCSVCGKVIDGSYLKHDNAFYCSRECFVQSLPVCELCGKHMETVATIGDHQYCTNCAAGSRCFQCQLPCNNNHVLPDGRHACASCYALGVNGEAKSRELYADALNELRMATGLRPASIPMFELIGVDKMREYVPDEIENAYVMRGTYCSTVTISEKTNLLGVTLDRTEERDERVFLLYGLSEDRFVVTASHELTHDLIEERFPWLLDQELWMQEGLCQYTAALVARRCGYTKALKEIEANKDPIYGKGYKWYVRKFGEDNWNAVLKWLNQDR